MIANPVQYIEKLLILRQKYADIILYSFSNDKEFSRTMKESFEMFLNSPNDRRPAEYLSLYVDEQMRVGFKDKSDDEINNALNATVALFRYLQNKDEFEEWYKTHLQKRLLGNKTASDDSEKLMILKLKSECGFQFTSKLEGMFNDLRVSQELMTRYRLYQQTSPASSSSSELLATAICDIDVTVLTKVNWPGARYASCPLPKEVKAAAESFSNYYLSHHTGRKIVWHTEKGTADVVFHTATRRFELTVSTWQMCVLSLFNESANSGVSFGEMFAALPGVPRDELQRHVLSLSTPKMRILLKNGKGKEITDEDIFTINAAFESRLLKIKVPLVSMRSAVQSGATGSTQAALGGETGGAPGGGGGGGGSGGQAADEDGDVIAQVENQRKNMIEASKLCQGCLIPSDFNDSRKAGASSNRLITAFALGLPVIADVLESYAPFKDYFHDIQDTPLSEFNKQLALYSRKIELAQETIVPMFRQEVLAQKWSKFLLTTILA
jgi:cullin 3